MLLLGVPLEARPEIEGGGKPHLPQKYFWRECARRLFGGNAGGLFSPEFVHEDDWKAAGAGMPGGDSAEVPGADLHIACCA